MYISVSQYVYGHIPENLGGHDEARSLRFDLHVASQKTHTLLSKRLSKVSKFLIRQRLDRRRVDGPA